MQMSAKQIEELVSQVVAQLAQNQPASNNGSPPPAAGAACALTGQDVLGAGGMEAFDHVYDPIDVTGQRDPSPFPRINRILRRVHATPQGVDDERAMLYTEGHQKFGGSVMVKNAKIIQHILEKVSIQIYADELIVGEIAAPSRQAPVYPEFSYGWMVEEMNNSPWDQRRSDIFQIPDQVRDNLLSIADYWQDNNIMDITLKVLTEEEIKGSSAGGRPVFHPNLYLYCGIGHLNMGYPTLLAIGYKGIKQKIKSALENLNMAHPDAPGQREFYTAQLIMLDAASTYFRRYAALAQNMAAQEKDPVRRAELERIAQNCSWVSEEAPRTYWEAVQLYLLATNITLIESNGHSISFGRFDQNLYPFYKKDMEAGTLTKKEACELIENFYIKIYETTKIRDEVTSILNSEVGMGGTLLLVGGCDKNGQDGTNDLSFLGIEAHAHTQLPDPWFAVRWSKNSPWEYKVKVVNSIRIGTGQPKIFNDEAIIPAAIATGRSLEDSRNYCMVGCVEIDAGGKEYGAHDASYFSKPKVLELALNNGRCIDCAPSCARYSRCAGAGESLGPRTGSLADFTSIDQVKRSYETQMKYWVEKMVAFVNIMEMMHEKLHPVPYLSAHIEGCIEKGKDCSQGGAVYNFTGPQGVGTATVADSMSVIKQLVFDEKRISGKEILDAMRSDWVGYEALYQLVNSDKVHHYGNDDDYADEFAVWGTAVYCNEVLRHQNVRGGRYLPGVYSVSANVGIGLVQAATPDGRKAGEAVSNCLGPVHTVVGCHDRNGPTAMARSAAKIDHIAAGNGTLTNVRFTPNCVAGETGRENMITYVDSYFQGNAQHIQFNIVNTDTLKDAQKHPENYPNLLVRVAGYSAYFTRMSKELQDDLIGRNSYDSFN